MTCASQVIEFHRELNPDWQIPKDFELIFPFDNSDTWQAFETFFNKYFNDDRKRHFLFGINPGRFGAGITGIPFTDPKILNEIIGIDNPWVKRNELSSVFIYKMIEAMGGPGAFYHHFYITSVCPLGFLADGKNINYYDDKNLQNSVEPYIISNIERQIEIGASRKEAFSIGQGKNYKYLVQLNKDRGYFNEIIALPHPRWVMQYRRKTMEKYIDEYVTKLSSAVAEH